jgi:cobalt-zinc-cadmium efflux system membrane fusion protein
MKKLIIPALLLIAACGKNGTENTKENNSTLIKITENQIKNGGIVFAAAEKQSVTTTISVSGSIDVPPQNLVSVSFPLGGYLKYTGMLPGTRVVKGQVLAVMQDMQYIQLQQDYLTAKAKLDFALAESKRQTDLYKERAGSEKSMQQAKSEAEALMANMAALAEKLRLLGINPQTLNEKTISGSVNVVSPINGYVASVNANVGKYLSPTDVIMELVNPDDIHLNLKVFEKDLPFLEVGQKVVCWSNAQPNIKYEAAIILVGRNFGADRSVEVHCHFNNESAHLTPGLFMNAEVNVSDSNALVLTEEAVVRWQNKYFVFLQREAGTVEMLPVTTGGKNGENVQVVFSQKLPDNAKFVVKGAYSVLMMHKNIE